MSVDAYIPVEFSTSLDNSQISTETEVAMGSLSMTFFIPDTILA